nr:hypothetical protein [Tanacetum cinerariifolium]
MSQMSSMVVKDIKENSMAHHWWWMWWCGLEVFGGASNGLSRKGLFGCGEGVFLEKKGEEFNFVSKEDEVVPRVEDVSLVDGVLEGAFGGDGDDDFAMGEDV